MYCKIVIYRIWRGKPEKNHGKLILATKELRCNWNRIHVSLKNRNKNSDNQIAFTVSKLLENPLMWCYSYSLAVFLSFLCILSLVSESGRRHFCEIPFIISSHVAQEGPKLLGSWATKKRGVSGFVSSKIGRNQFKVKL